MPLKIVCIDNNPQKIKTYDVIISLYANHLLKLVNKKDKLKCNLVFDEFSTLTVDIIPTISSRRSNRIAITLGIQSVYKLKKDYCTEHSNVIACILGNIISGQVIGESIKNLAFFYIVQDK